jgi:DNA-binding transcriptional LysR family regulator
MELRQLQMLLAVAEVGSYIQAGKRLNISHSAIHRQVRLLEEELEEHLLVRAGRNVELTEAGRLLVGLSRRVERDIAHTGAELRELSNLQSGTLRIGTGSTMLVFSLPEVLNRFRTEFPGVTVHVMTGTADQVIADIESGNLELGIIYLPSDLPERRQSVQYELLYAEEFVFAVGKGHPLARLSAVTLRDIARYPFISYSKTSYVRRSIERLFQRADVHPTVIMELENEEAMEKMIEINMGIAVLAKRRAVSDRIHYLRARELAVQCDVALVLPKTDYLPRATREFARVCRLLRGGPGSRKRASKA